MARAELLEQEGYTESCVAAVYGEAMAAYSKACMLSSSEEGDDLAGLLFNWGVGLHSLGTHVKVNSITEASKTALLKDACWPVNACRLCESGITDDAIPLHAKYLSCSWHAT